MKFPTHKAGLHLTHNAHLDCYESVAKHLEQWPDRDGYFESPEHRQRSIDTNELWELHWYPRTPISFIVVHAPTLAELMDYALAVGLGDDAEWNGNLALLRTLCITHSKMC